MVLPTVVGLTSLAEGLRTTQRILQTAFSRETTDGVWVCGYVYVLMYMYVCVCLYMAILHNHMSQFLMICLTHKTIPYVSHIQTLAPEKRAPLTCSSSALCTGEPGVGGHSASTGPLPPLQTSRITCNERTLPRASPGEEARDEQSTRRGREPAGPSAWVPFRPPPPPSIPSVARSGTVSPLRVLTWVLGCKGTRVRGNTCARELMGFPSRKRGATGNPEHHQESRHWMVGGAASQRPERPCWEDTTGPADLLSSRGAGGGSSN